MTLHSYLTELLQYTILFPAAALCLLPMKDRLRLPLRRVLLLACLTLVPVCLLSAWFSLLLDKSINSILLFAVLPCFALYCQITNAELYKCVSTFLLVCALMSFMGNFANGFEAAVLRGDVSGPLSRLGALFHFGISALLVLLLAYPLLHYGCRLINELDVAHVWNILSLISCLFLCFNLLIIPENYANYYIPSVFRVFWYACVLLFLLLLLIYVSFYFIASGIMDAVRNAARVRVLETQAQQYAAQQKYLETTAQLRHDFNHSLVTLRTLVDEGRYEALSEYLDGYIRSIPVKTIQHFCANYAVNALLNYYCTALKDAQVELRWQIDLPEQLPLPDAELCSILGNILDNAQTACLTVPEAQRYLQLSITTRHDTHLYIVQTNSFDGRVLKYGTQYHSTKPTGSGLGLSSVDSVARKYGGWARFQHDKCAFYTDIVLPLHAPK